MIGALTDALAARSGRERLLLWALVFVALPLALYVAVAEPMLAGRDAAAQALAEDRALRAWVAARAEEMPADAAPGAASDAAATPPLAGPAELERGLVAAGLRQALSRLAGGADGQQDLAFEDAPFDALAGWMEQTLPATGYRLGTFRIERGADPGRVSADFTLTPPAP